MWINCARGLGRVTPQTWSYYGRTSPLSIKFLYNHLLKKGSRHA